MKRTWMGCLLVGPLFLGFLVFYVVPFCQVVWDSFCVGAGRNQVFAGFSNYERMFQNDMFLLAFGNSLRFLAIGLPAIMVLSYALALFLKSLAKQYSLLRTLSPALNDPWAFFASGFFLMTLTPIPFAHAG